MVNWLLVALLTIPLVDAALLVVIGTRIGWVATVMLVVLTALVGSILVRAEGRRTIRKIAQTTGQGELPTDGLIDGGMLIAAGAFLLTPGVLTDLIGFLFVVPLTRAPIRNLVKRRVIIPMAERKTGGFVSGNVYTVGYPTGEDFEGTDPRDLSAEDVRDMMNQQAADDTVDLDADEYAVDIEEKPADEVEEEPAEEDSPDDDGAGNQ